MFTCCAFFPLAMLCMVGPTMAAARGVRAFLLALAVEISLAGFLLLLDLPDTMQQIHGWPNNSPLIWPFLAMLVLPMLMGGVILYARHAESIDPGTNCRVCGYDLRESRDRCPECGTQVRVDPDRF